ncbi:ubiquitin-like domain-containing protein CIP73 isoform X2 [Phragmites australis]|uniref:ubiquitin-like domain-containing protein CIP73 isoform X2 n=1 Tax=Phragmites australis TaxID=29695 RepID=UPI002D784DFB|nr:ubiquitin-like domain-containing protein CIP73 isoform X2 [Phragmites australis]
MKRVEIMDSSSDVQMSHCAGDSETTIEIKIKTLDSQTYNLRVNKCVPVPLLKEKIATVTGILSEQQRLICRGRVLKDDELLSAYHVEDGHTLHLVVRQPGQSATSGNAGTEANTSNSGRRRGPTVARSIVLEAVNVDHGSSELPAFAAQIIQSLLGPISTQSSGAPAPSDTRPSEATQSIIPDNVRAELDQQQGPLLFQSEPAYGSSQPNLIPDSLTTISQYIDFMRDSFRREGFNQNGQIEGNVEHRTAGSVLDTQNLESQPDSASTLGLPTAALLAETMHSTRQIVVEQAGALLSQLSTQLGDLVNVTDSASRRNLQSNAMRSGVLLQNLGSLLLELGRTTMMLRINPASLEAVVNSGAALYISPSGPNPLMVEPVPFFPGRRSVQMGPIFSSFSSQGSVLHPRDVEIHVHTSGPVPVASTNPSEPAGAQAQQHTNRTGDALHTNIGEAFAGVAGGAPFSVESGVRLLPLRTVVAMPAGISRAPSRSSSGGVDIIYPLLNRIQQRTNTNVSDQSPTERAPNGTHPNQQSIPQSSQAREAANLGAPVDVNVGNSSETSPGQQNGLGPLSQIMDSFQWIGSLFSGENGRANGTSQQAPMASAEQGDARNRGTPEVSGASEEELRFANMVRQIMPFISQVETQHQSGPPDSSSTPSLTASESSNRARDGPSDSRSLHQHNRDRIDEPNSKRQRTSD